jgi:hypothetical protein
MGENEPPSHGLPIDPNPGPHPHEGPSLIQTSPLTDGGAHVPLVHSLLVNMVTLYLGSRLYASFMMLTPMLKMGFVHWSRIRILLCPLLGCRCDQHP